MREQGKAGTSAGTAGGAPADRAGDTGTLRDAFRRHPAGPELLAVLNALADRPLPAGWQRWDAARWDEYLDAVLAESRAQRAGASDAGRG
jgi:hypothetical protein